MDTQMQLLPALLQYSIGNRKITIINDSFFIAGESYFTHLPENGVGQILRKNFRPDTPTLTTSIFIIEGEGQLPILIDTGMGDRFAPDMQGRLLEALPLLGLSPDQIGTILLTHLHGDHFYGLVSQGGSKNFPNARIWFSDAEYDYWINNKDLSPADQDNAVAIKQALALYERLQPAANELLPGITSVALPGHTPGHTGFLLESQAEKILFCGDILTIPAVQAAMPEIGFATDVNYSEAVRTRIDVLKKAAHERLLLAGPHFEFPCLSYVKIDGDGFQLIPKQQI
ncbi:MBL fold metallo-hydrolase [Flavobacterium rakeshii]|uniref:MBL fold metallo-hydrolase n=1 Tax=Flavobacterium rakeshii TaxID=1038845 RepID=A0A6N8HG01_9FLAO|nr:MBL fold metallo-hydrolase [Flavobacterium rakeshii]MUV04652.1 MBL fold metallo-hydrolase [Flavobacterium rakeshii]